LSTARRAAKSAHHDCQQVAAAAGLVRAAWPALLLNEEMPMASDVLFRDRTDAGRKLASHLMHYASQCPVVIGLPRGGVPVATEVAAALGAPLDVCVVRKVGAPMQPELAIGAVAEEDVSYIDSVLMQRLGISPSSIREHIEAKRSEIADRVRRFRKGSSPVDVRGKTVIVVDDGIATGATARVAIMALRARGATRIVLAVPVGARDSLEQLAEVADEVVCPHSEIAFFAVGEWYIDFAPTTDDDVVAILSATRQPSARMPRSEQPSHGTAQPHRFSNSTVHIPLPTGQLLAGGLTHVPGARGVVIFAHGSGSSRRSPRNQFVAQVLHEHALSTLLFDLLTEEEERIDDQTGELRFDVKRLAQRLIVATDWMRTQQTASEIHIGYFGASTGAAAALVAAAMRPKTIAAIVSRGGRPDLAAQWLDRVLAPTLLLVGELDTEVMALNQSALSRLARAPTSRLEIIAGATHLFEEPGALQHVARLASEWFETQFQPRSSRSPQLISEAH